MKKTICFEADEKEVLAIVWLLSHEGHVLTRNADAKMANPQYVKEVIQQGANAGAKLHALADRVAAAGGIRPGPDGYAFNMLSL